MEVQTSPGAEGDSNFVACSLPDQSIGVLGGQEHPWDRREAK